MTTYTIRIGYQSGDTHRVGKLKPIDLLTSYVYILRRAHDKLIEAVRQFDNVTNEVLDVILVYGSPTDKNSPIKQRKDEETGETYFAINASGGGEYRTAKEAVARAFCRLILNECHLAGIEICINVV